MISLKEISLFRSQKPDRKTMRAQQTSNYLNFKEDFEKALSTVNTDKPRDFRLSVDITTPDDSRSTGNLIRFWHSGISTPGVYAIIIS